MQSALAPAAALVALLVLAGCSSPTEAPGDSADAPIAAPAPLIDLDCESLAEGAAVSAAFSAATVPVDLSWYSSGDYYTLSQLGAEQAGALRCEWSDGGGASERYLQVTVLPDAADEWASLSSEVALYQPRSNEFGETSLSSCSTTNGYASCRIDSLVGDRWISANLAGLTSVDAAADLMQTITSSVQNAAPAETSWSAPEPLAPTCTDLLPPAGMTAALGSSVDEWANPLPTVGVYHGGFLAAGGTLCQWRNSFDSTSAMTVNAMLLPGGSWAWAENWAEEPHRTVTRQPLDGLGDDAYEGCSVSVDDTDCWVSVLVDDHWLSIFVNDESSNDERAVAAELATLALEYLTTTKEQS